MGQAGAIGRAALAAIRAPLWVAGIASGDKSFRRNPVIGSRALNGLGLHVARLRLAAAMADRRRPTLGRRIDATERAGFDRDGLIVREGFLPADAFAALKAELAAVELPAWEMRQGQTVQRMAPLGGAALARLPRLEAVLRDPAVRARIHYAASRAGEPVFYLQTVLAEADGPDDPQTALHSDTFHSTVKAWLFLHDVAAEDGPFVYVPGSHRLTPERLAWEREQSLTARAAADSNHAAGSFRITAGRAQALGYGEPIALAVRANTLVIADTLGFHARARSTRPSTRVALHITHRRNPFPPWAGGDLRALPGLRGREMDLYLWSQRLSWRWLGRGAGWRAVGAVRLDSPAHI